MHKKLCSLHCTPTETAATGAATGAGATALGEAPAAAEAAAAAAVGSSAASGGAAGSRGGSSSPEALSMEVDDPKEAKQQPVLHAEEPQTAASRCSSNTQQATSHNPPHPLPVPSAGAAAAAAVGASSSGSNATASLVEVGGHRWYWRESAANSKDAGDFVGAQCLQFLQVGQVLARDLRRVKSSLLTSLLEENQSALRLSERADVLSSLLQRYGEMQRWGHLRQALCAGLRDAPMPPFLPNASAAPPGPQEHQPTPATRPGTTSAPLPSQTNPAKYHTTKETGQEIAAAAALQAVAERFAAAAAATGRATDAGPEQQVLQHQQQRQLFNQKEEPPVEERPPASDVAEAAEAAAAAAAAADAAKSGNAAAAALRLYAQHEGTLLGENAAVTPRPAMTGSWRAAHTARGATPHTGAAAKVQGINASAPCGRQSAAAGVADTPASAAADAAAGRNNAVGLRSSSSSSSSNESCSFLLSGGPVGGGGLDLVCCCVCWLGEISSLNPLYSCVRCLLCCHKHCYGVGRMGETVEGEDWLCRRCEAEKRALGTQWMVVFRPMTPKCEICCRGGGALKPTATGGWVHIFCCVFLMPEVSCLDLQRLEPWCLRGLQTWRRHLRCSLCGLSDGVCLRCSHLGCTDTFHPMCAWLGGLFCSAETIAGLFLFVRGTLDHCFPRLRVTSFCFKHTPEMPGVRRSGALQAILRSRRYCTRDHCPELHALSERKGAFFLKRALPAVAATRRSTAAAAAAAAVAANSSSTPSMAQFATNGMTPAAATSASSAVTRRSATAAAAAAAAAATPIAVGCSSTGQTAVAASGNAGPHGVAAPAANSASGCVTSMSSGDGAAAAAAAAAGTAAAGAKPGDTRAAAAAAAGGEQLERLLLEEVDFYQDHCCAVCLLPKITASINNPFFYCSRCGVSVHRMCYGVPAECLPLALRPELQQQQKDQRSGLKRQKLADGMRSSSSTGCSASLDGRDSSSSCSSSSSAATEENSREGKRPHGETIAAGGGSSSSSEAYVPVPFLCEPCRYTANRDEVYCQLCPRRGGALKLALPTSCGYTPDNVMSAPPSAVAAAVAGAIHNSKETPLQFVHMTCALWTPGLEAADSDALSPILGVDLALQGQVQQTLCSSSGSKRDNEQQQQLGVCGEGDGEKDGGRLVCSICGLSFGVCLTCCARGCRLAFHALCAQLRGCFLEMAEAPSNGFTATAFCLKHSRTRNQVSPCVRLLLRLRSFLELSRMLIGQVSDRESSKRMYISQRRKSLAAAYPFHSSEPLHAVSQQQQQTQQQQQQQQHRQPIFLDEETKSLDLEVDEDTGFRCTYLPEQQLQQLLQQQQERQQQQEEQLQQEQPQQEQEKLKSMLLRLLTTKTDAARREARRLAASAQKTWEDILSLGFAASATVETPAAPLAVAAFAGRPGVKASSSRSSSSSSSSSSYMGGDDDFGVPEGFFVDDAADDDAVRDTFLHFFVCGAAHAASASSSSSSSSSSSVLQQETEDSPEPLLPHEPPCSAAATADQQQQQQQQQLCTCWDSGTAASSGERAAFSCSSAVRSYLVGAAVLMALQQLRVFFLRHPQQQRERLAEGALTAAAAGTSLGGDAETSQRQQGAAAAAAAAAAWPLDDDSSYVLELSGLNPLLSPLLRSASNEMLLSSFHARAKRCEYSCWCAFVAAFEKLQLQDHATPATSSSNSSVSAAGTFAGACDSAAAQAALQSPASETAAARDLALRQLQLWTNFIVSSLRSAFVVAAAAAATATASAATVTACRAGAAVLQQVLRCSSNGWSVSAAPHRAFPPREWSGSLRKGAAAIGRRVALYSPYMGVWYAGIVVYCDEQRDKCLPSSSSSNRSSRSGSDNCSNRGDCKAGRYLVAYDDGDCAWVHLEGITDVLLFHLSTEGKQLWMEALKRRRQRKLQLAVSGYLREKRQTFTGPCHSCGTLCISTNSSSIRQDNPQQQPEEAAALPGVLCCREGCGTLCCSRCLSGYAAANGEVWRCLNCSRPL